MAEMMTGFCAICGTGQTMQAETQEEADRKATQTCNCPEGKPERIRRDFRRKIRASAAEYKEKEITPLDDETVRIVMELADLVIAGRLNVATITWEEQEIEIKRTASGLKFSRKKRLEVNVECKVDQ